MPQALCFDTYDTLLRLDDPAGRLHAQLAAAGVAVSEEVAAEAFAAEADYYRQHSLAGSDAAGLAALRDRCAQIMGARIAAARPHTLSPAHLVDILLKSLHFVPTAGCRECLSALARRGLALAVVSNWDCSLPDVLEHLDLAAPFRIIVASAPTGCEKPDPRIWQPALAALQTAPARVWHVGDERVADGLGARSAGLRPVLVGGARLDGEATIESLLALPALVESGIDDG